MPTPAVIKGSDHFFATTYEGNGGGQKVGKFVPFTDNGTIAKSCMFNDDDTPRLYRQISAGNRKTYTISLWFSVFCLFVIYNHSFCTYFTYEAEMNLSTSKYNFSKSPTTKATTEYSQAENVDKTTRHSNLNEQLDN